MDCREAKELLSYYIEGMLEERDKALVEQHLAGCKSCAGEFESLRAVIGELSLLKSGPEAPDNFLEMVHRRIERGNIFQETLRRLFVPVRVKVPIEIAGTLIAALLVVVVINRSGTVETSSNMAQRLMEKPLMKREAALSKSADKELRYEYDSLKESAYKIKADSSEMKSGSIEMAAESMAVEEYVDTGFIEIALSISPHPPQEHLMHDDEVLRARIGQMAGVASNNKMPVQLPALSLPEAVGRLEYIASFVGGAIISIEYENDTNAPRYIIAEIPVDGLNAFMDELDSLGDILKSLPDKEMEGPPSVILRIELVQ